MQRINDVMLYGDNLFRILAKTAEGYIWISLDSDKALPEGISASEIEAEILSESLRKVEDPYAYLVSKVPEEDSTAGLIRDKRFKIVENLVNHPGIYQRRGRGALIQGSADMTGTPRKTIYAYLRQYWQRGCVPNALLPDYDKSGGKGKRRLDAKVKLGRPREKLPPGGAIVDEQVAMMFRTVLDRYVLSGKGQTLPYVHRRFLSMFEAAYPEAPKEDYPSLAQLRFFYEREYALSDRIRLVTNRIEYEKDIRPLQGTATSGASGPGARYEIDATIADIYLLSNDRQRIVGRPTLYVVVDAFSRLITGFYVGFENPSYAAAMLALANAMTDKSELCQSFGFEVSPEDWPAIGLPDAILADRGELLGHQIESLEKAFGVVIENTPPYRADAKGIVERNFRTLQAHFKPFAPGVVTKTKSKKRGGKDYRLDATLTLDEFTGIILASILHRNGHAVLSTYDRDPDMPDDIPSKPIDIWRWGIQHRSGRLRSAPEEALRIALMPRQRVTLSNHGIRCFGAFYTCKELMASGWLHRNRQQRPKSFQAAYDPAVADRIYVYPDKNSSDYWECSLTDRSREFRGKSMFELRQSRSQQNKVNAAAKIEDQISQRNLEEYIEKTIKNAERLRPVHIGSSKKESLSGLRANREKEKGAERTKRRAGGQKADEPRAENVTYIHRDKDEEAFPDLIDELFGDEE